MGIEHQLGFFDCGKLDRYLMDINPKQLHLLYAVPLVPINDTNLEVVIHITLLAAIRHFHMHFVQSLMVEIILKVIFIQDNINLIILVVIH